MPLKLQTTKSRKGFALRAYAYRVPLPVTKIRTFANGDSYSVCPRCANTMDREYMCFCDRCGQKLNWSYFAFAKPSHAVTNHPEE